MKKKFRVIVREFSGTCIDIDNIIFSRIYDFSHEHLANQFFYNAIGSFIYAIDDIEDIFKLETDDKKQLDIFCRGFVRRFILIHWFLIVFILLFILI